jgi:hypothetical protein
MEKVHKKDCHEIDDWQVEKLTLAQWQISQKFPIINKKSLLYYVKLNKLLQIRRLWECHAVRKIQGLSRPIYSKLVLKKSYWYLVRDQRKSVV